MQLKFEAEQNEQKLKAELRKAQALATEAMEKCAAAEEARTKKMTAVKDLKLQLATAQQQIESGKMQIQQLTGMLAKAVAGGASFGTKR